MGLSQRPKLSERLLHSTLLPDGGIILSVTYLLFALNSLLMVIMPIIIAIVIYRKTGAGWRLFFIGAVTFILSQVLHIPFNAVIERTGWLPSDLGPWINLLVFAAFYGLSAGVFEEVARYLTYRFWAKDARSWSRGMMLGAGHGGAEAILLGLLLLVNNLTLLYTAGNEMAMNVIPADQREIISSMVETMYAMPWYEVLMGAVERLFTLVAHLALSVMVLQVFLRRSIGWLFLAIGYHAFLNATALVVAQRWGIYASEAALGLITLLSLFIIFRLRTPEPIDSEPEPLPPLATADTVDLSPTDDVVDRSQYH